MCVCVLSCWIQPLGAFYKINLSPNHTHTLNKQNAKQDDAQLIPFMGPPASSGLGVCVCGRDRSVSELAWDFQNRHLAVWNVYSLYTHTVTQSLGQTEFLSSESLNNSASSLPPPPFARPPLFDAECHRAHLLKAVFHLNLPDSWGCNHRKKGVWRVGRGRGGMNMSIYFCHVGFMGACWLGGEGWGSSLSHGFSLSCRVSVSVRDVVHLLRARSRIRAGPCTHSPLLGDILQQDKWNAHTHCRESKCLFMTLERFYLAWTDLWHVTSPTAHSH